MTNTVKYIKTSLKQEFTAPTLSGMQSRQIESGEILFLFFWVGFFQVNMNEKFVYALSQGFQNQSDSRAAWDSNLCLKLKKRKKCWGKNQFMWENRPIGLIFLYKSQFFFMLVGCIGPLVWFKLRHTQLYFALSCIDWFIFRLVWASYSVYQMICLSMLCVP